MTALDRSAVLAAFLEAALAAGREIMAVYAEDFGTLTKDDHSPVTEADTRAEAAILAVLARRLPGVPVVAEEEAAAGRVPADLGRAFVLVDPLDGTKEFIKKNGEFCTLIGLVEDGRPSVGVIASPALGRLWTGVVGTGAAVAEIEPTGAPGAFRPIGVRAADPARLVALTSRSHGTDGVTRILDRLAPVESRILGSALKFAKIAEGEGDVHLRFEGTSEWDTAAGEAVVIAAGGTVIGYDGRPMAYAKRGRSEAKDFKNPGYVVLGDARLAPTVLEASAPELPGRA